MKNFEYHVGDTVYIMEQAKECPYMYIAASHIITDIINFSGVRKYRIDNNFFEESQIFSECTFPYDSMLSYNKISKENLEGKIIRLKTLKDEITRACDIIIAAHIEME